MIDKYLKGKAMEAAYDLENDRLGFASWSSEQLAKMPVSSGKAKSHPNLRNVARSTMRAEGVARSVYSPIIACGCKSSLIKLIREGAEAVKDVTNNNALEQGLKSPEPATAPTGAEADAGNALLTLIGPAIESRFKAALDNGLDALNSEIETMLNDRIAEINPPPVKVEIVRHDGGKKVVSGERKCHRSYPDLLKEMQCRDKDGLQIPMYVWGPHGTGKTTAGIHLAEDIFGDPKKFDFNGAIDNDHKLRGFVDANGVFQETAFYRMFSGGGLYLFDELDGSMRGAVLAFNAALSNGYADFAGHGRVYRHKDCYILGAGNTPLDGTGAEDGYFRIQHDASFRDRFAFMPWPIDEALEASFVPSEYRFWYDKVLKMRRNCEKHGSTDAPSPRAVYWGVARLEQGVSIARCEEALLKRHLPDEVWEKLRP